MDETEALCTKIGIMVNGELKCLGSLQHLKKRYGDGYTLSIKIAIDPINDPEQQNINEFLSFFLENFNQTELKERQDGFLNIHMNNNSPKIFSSVFELIESNKSRYSIEYYVITQTNLEQIFLNFASKQLNSNLRNLPKVK
jgi:ABC-type multidrug transport system ATPase subunit